MPNDPLLQDVARKVIDDSLGVSVDEPYLFCTDFNSRWEEHYGKLVVRRQFLHRLYEAFVADAQHRPLARHDKYESSTRHGGEPGENIWRLAFGESIYSRLVQHDLLWKLIAEVELTEEEADHIQEWLDRFRGEIVRAVAAFPWFSTTHTRFTRLLHSTGCRIASMPLLTASVIEGPMQADWNEVSRTTKAVYDALCTCVRLHVTCPEGTDLWLEVGPKEHIHQDTGILRNAGALGNLPGGEAYLVPAPGTAKGTLVFRSAPEYPEIEATPLSIDDGQVAFALRETAYSRLLENKFGQDFQMRHVAELGIGTNPLARDVSSMIEGEKIQGTVHVALGDDKAMGGENEATEHLDHIIEAVDLIGETKDGQIITFIEGGVLQF